MKTLFLMLSCLIFSVSSKAQQFLWSTVDNSAFKRISKEEVSNEATKFYSQYTFYCDGAGFNKTTFYKQLNQFGTDATAWNDLKKTILEAKELTVFAIRGNSGRGSEVMIIFVSQDNVNFVKFSNNPGASCTYSGQSENEKRKFASWLDTLKN
jgi:hypothetical protein